MRTTDKPATCDGEEDDLEDLEGLAELATDVQVVDVVYEDAPFDLRHQFWLACSRRGFERFASARDAWQRVVVAASGPPDEGGGGDGEDDAHHDQRARGLAHDRRSILGSCECRFDAAIAKDLDRIFPGGPAYLDSEAMKDKVFSILRTYAMEDAEVGYCQGMAYPATLAALFLEERDALGLLRELMDARGCNLRTMYVPGLGPLQGVLARIDARLPEVAPEVGALFAKAHVPAMLFATQWVLTCFAASFPLALACRTIDAMLACGNAASVLERTTLAMLWACRGDLAQCGEAEEIIAYLKTKCFTFTSDQLRAIVDAALRLEVWEGGGKGEGEVEREGGGGVRVRLRAAESNGVGKESSWRVEVAIEAHNAGACGE